ncbi:hypothetical protein JL722_7101 [Aureococcus anophagefferens]|nr:hypothetical protein JL722_7101 [Aureococcus anophagefferens]
MGAPGGLRFEPSSVALVGLEPPGEDAAPEKLALKLRIRCECGGAAAETWADTTTDAVEGEVEPMAATVFFGKAMSIPAAPLELAFGPVDGLLRTVLVVDVDVAATDEPEFANIGAATVPLYGAVAAGLPVFEVEAPIVAPAPAEEDAEPAPSPGAEELEAAGDEPEPEDLSPFAFDLRVVGGGAAPPLPGDLDLGPRASPSSTRRRRRRRRPRTAARPRSPVTAATTSAAAASAAPSDPPAGEDAEPAEEPPPPFVGYRAAWSDAAPSLFLPRETCVALAAAAAAGEPELVEIARKVPPPPPDPEAEVDPEAPAPEPTVETATVTLDAKGFWGGATTLDVSGAVVAPPPPAPDLPDAEESVGESLAQTSLEDPGETGEPPAEAADGAEDAEPEPEPEPAKHLSELLDDHGTELALGLTLSKPLVAPVDPSSKPTYEGLVPKTKIASLCGTAGPRDFKVEFKDEIDDVVTTLSEEMAKIIISKDPTGKAPVEDFDERQWLYGLNTGTLEPADVGGKILGPYHAFKERLKPCIQRVVRKYFPDAPTTPHRDCDDWRELGEYDRFLNAVYAELVTNVIEVTNKRFRDAESNQEPESKPSPFVEEHDDDDDKAVVKCKVFVEKGARCVLESGPVRESLKEGAADAAVLTTTLLAVVDVADGDLPKARRTLEKAARANNTPGQDGARGRAYVGLAAATWLHGFGLTACATKALDLALAGEARASALARVQGPLRDSFTPPELRAELDASAVPPARRGELGPAEVVATKATYAAPDLGRAWLALGLVHDAARRTADAAGTLARALALLNAPESPEPAPLWLFCRVCDLAILQGDLDLAKDHAEAEAALTEANIRNPDSAETWGYLVLANLGQYVLGDSKRIDQAASCLDQAKNLFLDDGNILTDVGVAFAEVDRLTVAAEVLAAAAALPYGDFTKHAKLALARVLAKQNKVVEATDEYASLLGTATGDEAAILKAELAPSSRSSASPLLDSPAPALRRAGRPPAYTIARSARTRACARPGRRARRGRVRRDGRGGVVAGRREAQHPDAEERRLLAADDGQDAWQTKTFRCVERTGDFKQFLNDAGLPRILGEIVERLSGVGATMTMGIHDNMFYRTEHGLLKDKRGSLVGGAVEVRSVTTCNGKGNNGMARYEIVGDELLVTVANLDTGAAFRLRMERVDEAPSPWF